LEVRLEGKIRRDGDADTGEKMTIVRRLTAAERCAVWTGVLVRENGKWFVAGYVHREGDLPAVILANGTEQWCRYGQRHREDGRPWFTLIGTKDGIAMGSGTGRETQTHFYA